MTVHFEIVLEAASAIDGSLVYRAKEYSFDTLLTSHRGFTSALLDDLNLEIDEARRIIAIWGLCPHTRWLERALTPPSARRNASVLLNDHAFSRGVSVPLNAEKYLPVYADRKTGWIQIKGTSIPSVAVEIFPGVILEITEEGQFCALWLNPKWV